MASSAHKSKDNKTYEQKSFEVVVEACRENDEKIKILMDKLETEKLRLAALNKLVQLHQGVLNVSSSNVVQNQLVQWLGVVPSVDSVETLTQQIELDLSATHGVTGCRITDCRAVLLDASQDVIRRLYEATIQVRTYEVQLSLVSEQQVVTGEEVVRAVQQIEFTPALPEMAALQQHMADSCCLYTLPRALHTLHELEEGQLEVVMWSADVMNLEVTSTKLRLVLSYVPTMTLKQQHGSPLSSAKKRDSKHRPSPRGKENRHAAVKQEQDTEEISEPSFRNDSGVTLRWEIAYCSDIRNFRYRFKLDVPRSVLERYSMSPAEPLLRGTKALRSAADVIELFSSLTH